MVTSLVERFHCPSVVRTKPVSLIVCSDRAGLGCPTDSACLHVLWGRTKWSVQAKSTPALYLAVPDVYGMTMEATVDSSHSNMPTSWLTPPCTCDSTAYTIHRHGCMYEGIQIEPCVYIIIIVTVRPRIGGSGQPWGQKWLEFPTPCLACICIHANTSFTSNIL